jgi:hypothetical protein
VSKAVLVKFGHQTNQKVKRQSNAPHFLAWIYLMHIAQNHLLYVRVHNPNPLCWHPHVLMTNWQMDRCYMSLRFFQQPKWGYYSNNIDIIKVLDIHTYSI